MSGSPFFQNFQWHPILVRNVAFSEQLQGPQPPAYSGSTLSPDAVFGTCPLPAHSSHLPPLPPLSSPSSSLQLLSPLRQWQQALGSLWLPRASPTHQVPRMFPYSCSVSVPKQGSTFFFPFSRLGLLQYTLVPPVQPGSPSQMSPRLRLGTESGLEKGQASCLDMDLSSQLDEVKHFPPLLCFSYHLSVYRFTFFN